MSSFSRISALLPYPAALTATAAAKSRSDLVEVPDGYRVTIRRSKTDQTGEGQEVAIPRGLRIQPVQHVQTWLQAAGITEGYLFKTVHRGGHVHAWGLRGADVAAVVKRHALAAGLDPREFSGHSLRAGFVTSAAETGASILKIQETSRHKSVDVLAGYVRRVDLFKDHAGQRSCEADPLRSTQTCHAHEPDVRRPIAPR